VRFGLEGGGGGSGGAMLARDLSEASAASTGVGGLVAGTGEGANTITGAAGVLAAGGLGLAATGVLIVALAVAGAEVGASAVARAAGGLLPAGEVAGVAVVLSVGAGSVLSVDSALAVSVPDSWVGELSGFVLALVALLALLSGAEAGLALDELDSVLAAGEAGVLAGVTPDSGAGAGAGAGPA
jgi:hypothetical protein